MKNIYQKNNTINNIENLLNFFSNEHQKMGYKSSQKNYISIRGEIKDNNLCGIIGNEEICIQPAIVDMLYTNKLLNSSEFTNIVNIFNQMVFIIEFQPDTYQKIYDCILQIKTKQKFKKNVEIIIPSTVKNIEEKEFSGYELLTAVKIPSSVKSIGDGAFLGCILLDNVSIPTSVQSINKNVFEGCKSLTKVKIPSLVYMIYQNWCLYMIQ